MATVPHRGALTVSPDRFDTHFATAAALEGPPQTKLWFTRGGKVLDDLPDGVVIYTLSDRKKSATTILSICGPLCRDDGGYLLRTDVDFAIKHHGVTVATLRNTRTHVVEPGEPKYALLAGH